MCGRRGGDDGRHPRLESALMARSYEICSRRDVRRELPLMLPTLVALSEAAICSVLAGALKDGTYTPFLLRMIFLWNGTFLQ